MPKHVVAPGDCLTSIAHRYGFSDPKKVWNDPANSGLRNIRPDPNLLFPGDEITIPDISAKPHSSGTGSAHKFVVKVPQKTLKVRFVDADDKPFKSEPYKLEFDSQTIEGKLDGDGLLEQKIPAGVREATVLIGGMRRVLLIGGLNPMRDVEDGGISGVQARLENLGYFSGPADGIWGETTQEAISRFQIDNGLDVTGEIDKKLIDALESAHGC